MKILYIDTETTGLDPVKNGILQISGIVEINNEQVEKFDIKIKPFETDEINPKSLDICKISLEDIKGFTSPEEGFKQLLEIFDRHVNRYDKNDKFVFCAYNADFDIGFLKEFFIKNGDKYFFAYVKYIKDPFQVVKYLAASRLIDAKNNKLGTICEYFGIEFKNAHDAMADVIAVMELSKRLDILLLYGMKSCNDK